MTHDELLKEINTIFLYEDEDKNEENPYLNIHFLLHQHRALRAVVELHKPVKDNRCEHCYTDEYFGGMHIEIGKYPCPTIQAIEKELS